MGIATEKKAKRIILLFNGLKGRAKIPMDDLIPPKTNPALGCDDIQNVFQAMY